MKLKVATLFLSMISTVSMASSPLILPQPRDLATVCAQFTNQLPSKQCILTDDILENTHFAVANNKHHQGNRETNIYLTSEYKRSTDGLILSAHRVPVGEKYNCADPGESLRLCDYVSGWIDTKGLWSTKGVTHGYVEVVATMPVSGDNKNELFTGMWPAIWMLPVNSGAGWPTHGEIDILEMHAANPLQALTTLHYGNIVGITDYADATFAQNPFYNNVSQKDNYSQYHVFGLEWNFDANAPYLTTWYDGHPVVTRKLNVDDVQKHYSILNSVFQPGQIDGYYLILNIATGGNFGPTIPKTSNGSGADADNPLLQMQIYSMKSYKLQ